MDSDLEEGEIVEEVEDAGKRDREVVSRRRSAGGQGRKARKKSVPRRQSLLVDGHNKRISNGVATTHDSYRHHHTQHRNKSRKRETPKRHVVEALSETCAASSRRKLVISVNNSTTKSTKPACDTEVPAAAAAAPVRKPVKFSIKPRKKSPALVNRNYLTSNFLQSLTDETSEISNGSDDDDTRSIISLPVPQKTPPELIVLDSDEENSEDVELLELRKQALEDLMAKIGREARESANKENSQEDGEQEVDEPYSPPDDDHNKSHQNVENLLPDELELPSIHQPPATFFGLREQNSMIEMTEDKTTAKNPSATTFFTSQQQLHSAPLPSYSLGTGDVDMRLLAYPSNPPESGPFVPSSSASFVPPNSASFVPQNSASFVPPTSATFVPASSAPISMQPVVQYPLYHSHRHQLNPYNGSGLLAPSNISFGFGGGPAPSNQGYNNNNNNNIWDHRPWQSYPMQQQHNISAPFGFHCPVPSPNIVHPTPQFSHHPPVERISRTRIFSVAQTIASSSVLRPIPPTSEAVSEQFRLDVDDRSVPIISDSSNPIIPDRSGPNIPDRSGPNIPDRSGPNIPDRSGPNIPDRSASNIPQISPPASPPPEETGMPIILKPPTPPPKQSDTKGKQSDPKGKQSDPKGNKSGPKGNKSGPKGKQSGRKVNKSGPKSPHSDPKKGNKSRSRSTRRRERSSRRRAKEENSEGKSHGSSLSRRVCGPRRDSNSPLRSRQGSRDDPDLNKDSNVPKIAPDLCPVRVQENIVVAICNENVTLPPPAQQAEVSSLDDSVQEDEEILRAQLLLEIANKKKFAVSLSQTSASSVSPSVSVPGPTVQPTVATFEQTLVGSGPQVQLNSVPTQPTLAPVQLTSAPAQPTFPPAQPTLAPALPTLTPAQPTLAPARPTPAPTAQPTFLPRVTAPQTLSFPFPLQGTGATITKTILNPRLKNRQIIRLVNNTGLSVGPNLTLRKTISNNNNNNTTSMRPNLHNIQRTIVNTNLLKKSSYNQAADPVMRNMKITVPNQVTRLIIPAGGDSSSEDESSGGSPIKTVIAPAKRKLAIASSLLPIGFEDSLNSLLRSSREQAKPTVKPKPKPPPNLKHLPLAKQEEYMRLKSQLEQYERKIQKKQAKKEVPNNVEGVRKTVPAVVGAKILAKLPQAASKSPKVSPPKKLKVAVVDQEVSSSNQAEDANLEDIVGLTTELVDQVSTSQGDKETGRRSSLVSKETTTIENVTETEVTSSGSPNCPDGDEEMIIIATPSTSDQEDEDMNEAQLLNSDDEERLLAEANAETEEDEPVGVPQMTSATEDKPFVVDSVKEREELYLREKLLKAALLKKMEASNDKLKLRKFEGDVLSSRKSINRELTSLLSEMVKLSDMKVKMKSQEEKVLMLREQLYAAEQQLNVTMSKVQTYETRRKDLTSRVISMRKDFTGLVKECRRQGQKVQREYKVPTGGALEMKSKLVEVCNQNLVFRRDNLKLSPRKSCSQALVRRSSASATLVAAANRVKRSFNLRFPHAPTTKLPSTPQQLKYGASRRAAANSRYKGRNFNKNFGLLTKHAVDLPEEAEESVFLLPKRFFKDVMMGPEVKPVPRGMIPILPYSVYESPLSSIREPGLSDRDSWTTPALGRNLDPFVTLCYFELRGMCNSVKCPFQHLYRPKT